MHGFFTGWYVIYTRPRHEKKILDRLQAKDFNVFLPTVRKLKIRNERKKYVDEPLFPSYLFVYLDNVGQYFTSLEVEGVVNYVRIGKMVARMKDEVINEIKLLSANQMEIELADDSFQPGRHLTIKTGPLSDLSCEIVDHKGRETMLVRVNLLKRVLLITLPTEHLMACS